MPQFFENTKFVMKEAKNVHNLTCYSDIREHLSLLYDFQAQLACKFSLFRLNSTRLAITILLSAQATKRR